MSKKIKELTPLAGILYQPGSWPETHGRLKWGNQEEFNMY